MVDAKSWGIASGYEDYNGQWRDHDPATVLRILTTMDAQTAKPPASLAIIVESGARRKLRGDVELEDGTTITLDRELPRDLPHGYHVVSDGNTRRPLIVCPTSCYLPEEMNAWGWGVQLYSARSETSWGIGDVGDLRTLARWTRERSGSALLVNPLNAVNPGAQEPSPYFPSSRRFRNPLYLRIEEVPGAGDAGADVAPLAAAGRRLNQAATIDRDAIYALKMAALGQLWERFAGDAAFDRYRSSRGEELEQFGVYMSLAARFGGGTHKWPRDHLDPHAAAVRRWREENRDAIGLHAWVQWLLSEQLQRAGDEIDLIHDLPIGVDPSGFDRWTWGDVFATDVTTGSPPDAFSVRGQDWGLPPFDPWKLRSAGYQPFIDTIRGAFEHGRGLRIDHVMGLFRLWWVPGGRSPAAGAYVQYPYRDLLALLALESHRARAYVIGEDLGTVEDRVRREMSKRNMLSYRVLWFEDDRPTRFPVTALAAVTNHDLPTIAGIWTGSDLEEQRALGLDVPDEAVHTLRKKLEEEMGAGFATTPTEAVIEATYDRLAEAPSRIVVATLEDALAVERRPNLPGTSNDQRPNWSIPLPKTVDELQEHPLALAVARRLSEGRSGRGGHETGDAQQRGLHVDHAYGELPDVRLHYAAAGAGPVVLLLHGFPDFWYAWRHQIPTLVEAGYRVIAPDMRGYNLSDQPRTIDAYSLAALTGDVAALLAHLGVRRARIVGHDWGAVVAWYFSMWRQDMVERLGIMNVPHPAHYRHMATNPRQLPRSWYIAAAQLPWLPERLLARSDYAALRNIFGRIPSFTQEDVDAYVEAARRSRLHGPLNYYRALARRPIGRGDIRRIDIPVLVLWGHRDLALSSEYAEPDPRWVPDSHTVHFPRATHWVNVDEADAVNELLVEFLSR